MNSIYFLSHKDFIYTRAQLLVWAAQGLNSPSIIHKSFVDYFSAIYQQVETEKIVIINWTRIKDISAHCFDNFLKTLYTDKKRPIILTKCDAIHDHFISILNENRISFTNELDYIVVGSVSDKTNIRKLLAESIDLENEFISKAVKDAFKKYDSDKKRMPSTPILSNGEFDASDILREPRLFSWVSMKLTDLFEELKDSLQKASEDGGKFIYTQLKILTASLRGAPFAAAVAHLSNHEFDTIDHLGPTHKLFDIEIIENVQKGIMYVYIGDFVIGGTEIRIAQAYARIFECEMKHAISIGSLLKPDSYKKHFILYSLVNLKEIEPSCEFSLTE